MIALEIAKPEIAAYCNKYEIEMPYYGAYCVKGDHTEYWINDTVVELWPSIYDFQKVFGPDKHFEKVESNGHILYSHKK